MNTSIQMTDFHPELRIGLIGAGRIGMVHAKAISAMFPFGIRLDSVSDITSEHAIALARQFTTSSPVHINDALESRHMDCAVIATPPCIRENLIYPLLSRGVPVLCEKPLGLNFEYARRLASAISSHNSAFLVSSKFLFTTGYKAVRALLNSNNSGTPRHLDVSFQRKLDISGNWRANPNIGGGGIIADVGPQTIDLVRGLIGQPIAVKAKAEKQGGFDVEDDACLSLVTKTGATAECRLSWCQADESNAYARLRTDNTTIELGWQRDEYQSDDGVWHPISNGYDQTQAFSAQLSWFIDAIRTAKPTQNNLADALNTSRIIAAAYQSVASGKWVDLPSGDD